MKKILDGTTRRVGSIFSEIDTNFIEVCNSILRIAFPDLTIKGYAETEPESPTLYDCYLVKESGTIWTTTVQKDQILFWRDSQWNILPWKITEINTAFQFLYFDANKIDIAPITGITGSDVQAALEQIVSALVTADIIVPSQTSGSGSGSGSI